MQPPPPFLPDRPFVPARGLAGAHAQTLFAHFARPRHRPRLVRERWAAPDGDVLLVDRLPAPASAPHLLVLHGLEGDSRTGYVSAMLRGAHARGFGAVALNFRSCGGEANLKPRFYHSGETGDARAVLDRLRREVEGPLGAVGFSLGGSVLVHLLVELGEGAPLSAAAAVSVPFDLTRCSEVLDGPGLGVRLYRERFLHSLKRKAIEKAERFPESFDPAALERLRSLRAFDDAVTAPLHGFRDAADYYRRCSSRPVVDRIRVPTLLLSSADDPMVPAASLPRDVDNPWISPVVTEAGGHVGFVAGSLVRPVFWGDETVLAFLERRLGARAGAAAPAA